MPRIFDNIDQYLLPAIEQALCISERADFAVGYFNLRGWKSLDSHIERWPGGDSRCCRLLVGMHALPEEQLASLFSVLFREESPDQKTALQKKKELAKQFRDQLTYGVPTAADEAGLRRLAGQLRAKKLIVKLYLRHNLHAKLYLMHRNDPINPIVGYLGSSNLTLSGLSHQGELNIDVLDGDATQKLASWFENRWNDRLCLDITADLIEVIEESWARVDLIPPYHIYLKMAYHLSHEARAGLAEFRIPKVFGNTLFDYQEAAVKIAARHLNKRGGVLIGDVVGLGKTLMATALARIFEDDFGMQTLIVSPKNLVPMWQQYRERYDLRGTVLSITQVLAKLPNLKRYRLILIDESHNLRNNEGKIYRAIREYIEKNECKCILLSATPYNKSYKDISNQLGLFLPEEKDLGIRPENLLRTTNEDRFRAEHPNVSPQSLAAFALSNSPDDWRELKRMFMVRRTRTFIMDTYAEKDFATGRKYLQFADGKRNYFPSRIPVTIKFDIDTQYENLYAKEVVDTLGDLRLPRYSLGSYETRGATANATAADIKTLQDLSRAGKRLKGFCRINLFKRLESSGAAFLLSVERHILRNTIYIHAIETGALLPIGSQVAELLDSRFDDTDEQTGLEGLDDEIAQQEAEDNQINKLRSSDDFKSRASELYQQYRGKLSKQFRWLSAAYFGPELLADLKADSASLLTVLDRCSQWESGKDGKLTALYELLAKERPNDKALIFTQFADTARYLGAQLQSRGIGQLAVATGGAGNVTQLAWRFSPISNDTQREVSPNDELRVLVATDVLSEGQNLQDCSIIVNYDLPWAIIRLIQRVGRVDRIGQQAELIRCYSFMETGAIEKIINLRSRVIARLKENGEVIGSDEMFFENEENRTMLHDLYNEKSNLDDGPDSEIDLSSYAHGIWKTATDADPTLHKSVPALPAVVFSTKQHQGSTEKPEGVLVYLSNTDGADSLAWIDKEGNEVTQSQYQILTAAECAPNTPALERLENHHELVADGVQAIVRNQQSDGGQLGKPNTAKYRAYHRLKGYAERIAGTLFDQPELSKALEEMLRHPLASSAADRLSSHLRLDISDEMLAELVLLLRSENRLCIIHDDQTVAEPKIICSMGMRP